MNDYGRRFGHLKESDKNLSGDDIREGLTAVVSVKISEPQFEGQTKTKLEIVKLEVLLIQFQEKEFLLS